MTTLQFTQDNRPNDYVYAKLSEHIYNKPEKGDEVTIAGQAWDVKKVVDGGYVATWGFYGALYKNNETRQAVVVFRGTSDNITWIENINSIVRNSASSIQRLEAFKLVKKALDYAKSEGYQLSFTGHSLGAFLASLSVFFVTQPIKTMIILPRKGGQ